MALFTRRLGLSAARAVIARPFQRGVAAATANVVRPIAAVWPKQPAGGSITRFVHVHAPPQAAPSSYTAFAVADAADGTFTSKTIPVNMGPKDVLVEVEACGVCHTDFYTLSRPGVVPGHETVGKVVAVGDDVSDFAVGTRSCSSVKSFQSKGVNGGYASHLVWDSRFVFPIPDGLAPEHAGPLLCAGATVYTALANNNVRPHHRVAVVGIGGLGHLGIQFAKAWGCHVTAISHSASKEQQARDMGAHAFVNTHDDPKLKEAGEFDFILSTVSADLPWDSYVKRLRTKGTLCVVGIPVNKLDISAGALIMKQTRVCGSLIGSRATMTDMLQFATVHGIKPIIETVPMSVEGIETAIAKVHNNTARYRMVLTTSQASS